MSQFNTHTEIFLVVDSNILISDFPLNTKPLQSVLRMGRKGRLRIVVPSLVFEEVTHKFEQDCEGFLLRLKNEGRRYGLPNSLLQMDLSHLCETYKRRLRHVLKEANAEIRPLPMIDNDGLARRAIYRRKPFNKDGEGYRDALIWETVKDVGREGPNRRVVFISGNSHDFGKDRLLPELLADLAQCGIAEGVISLESSMKRVAEKYVPAHEHVLERFQREVLGQPGRILGLADRMREALDSSIGHHDLNEALIGSGVIRLDLEDIRLRGVSTPGPPEIHAETAYEISDVETGIEAELTVIAEVEIEVSGRTVAPIEIMIDRPWEAEIYNHVIERRLEAVITCEVVVNNDLEIESVSNGILTIVPELFQR